MTRAARGEFVARDGRIARGQRTRESILRAYESLIVAADVPPTGAELAERAGVSARSVFTHFGDMDGVLAAAAQRALEWLAETQVDVSVQLPLGERLYRFTRRQAEILERSAPLYRMLRAVRSRGKRAGAPAVNELVSGVGRMRRDYVQSLFAREIEACPAEDRDDLLAALVVNSSWHAWEDLRFAQALDVQHAQQVMRKTLTALLRTPTG